MRSKFVLILALIGILISVAERSQAAWLVFSKPEFKGKVIDAETKEPIEGAVVVAVYSKQAIRLAPESVSITFNAREALTDKAGNFRIPSYITIIDPLSWSNEVDFFIFKPGYNTFPHGRVRPPRGMSMEISFEDFFSGEVGEEKEVQVKTDPWMIGSEIKKEIVPFGVVELPKLKTREEKLRRMMGTSLDFGPEELPLLHKAIDDEDRILDRLD